MLLSRCTPFTAALLMAGVLAVAVIPASAQVSTPTAPSPRLVLPLLRAAEYAPESRGPLVFVLPTAFVPPSAILPIARATLREVTAALGLRLVSAGGITVAVPRTMTVLTTKPGKANPFADLPPGETLKLLLGSFTPAQWKQAGSGGGIGASDLTDDQRLLWGQVFPETVSVQKSTLRPGEQSRTWNYTDTSFIETHPRQTARLRLNKAVTFQFYKVGAKHTSWMGDPYMSNERDGETKYMITSLSSRPDGTVPNSAFGVPLISEQPWHPKAGAVDFSAVSLDSRIALNDFPTHTGEAAPGAPALPPTLQALQVGPNDPAILPTVGDLLKRVSAATRIEFVADRRVRDLPVYLRGDSARAGDLLLALCGSVSGTFRKMQPGDKGDAAPLYLLTDDVDGIGTRTARLFEWGNVADETKRRLTENATAAAAKNNPLDALSFATDDPFALSSAQSQRIEDTWRVKKFGTSLGLSASEMSPALRDAVQKFAADRAEDGTLLQTERIRVSESLKVDLLLPEIQGVSVDSGDLGGGIGSQYLSLLAYDPSKAPSPAVKTPKKPVAAPETLGFASQRLMKQRRILIARPGSAAEAERIVRTAAGRGLTEVWLETSLVDTDAAASLLTAAVKAGERKIAVGAVVRLLRGGGLSGELDQNILGETGDVFLPRFAAAYTGDKKYLPYYQAALSGFAGWIWPRATDVAIMQQRIGQIASVPGLAGLTFRATGGPGWTGQKEGGDGLWPDTGQGYTPIMRRAFLREQGIDPTDIPEKNYSIRGISWDLGYFRENAGRDTETLVDNQLVRTTGANAPPPTAWWEFRQRKNTTMLADLYRSLRKIHPLLPLYMDDRLSYRQVNTDWFGTWDAAESLPNTSPFNEESETRAAARRTSKQIFAHWGQQWGPEEAAKPGATADFAKAVSAAALRDAPHAWDGLVIDLSGVPGASVADLLAGLPLAP